MSRETRLSLMRKIERVRKRKLVCYVTSIRQGIDASIDEEDVRVLKDHLTTVGGGEPIDLFIITYGGYATVPWAMANLIRSYHKSYDVLIPFKAMSAGTSLALGADNIIMGTSGCLSPVDL